MKFVTVKFCLWNKFEKFIFLIQICEICYFAVLYSKVLGENLSNFFKKVKANLKFCKLKVGWCTRSFPFSVIQDWFLKRRTLRPTKNDEKQTTLNSNVFNVKIFMSTKTDFFESGFLFRSTFLSFKIEKMSVPHFESTFFLTEGAFRGVEKVVEKLWKSCGKTSDLAS